MRVITKKVLITFLGLFLGLAAVSCGGNTDTTTTTSGDTTEVDTTIPALSNPDAVFYSTDNYQVTYDDLFQTLKVNDGLNQLLTMVDTDLLASYINSVTQAEINNKIKKLTYNTTDDTEIAKLTSAEVAKKIKSYNDSMTLLGYSGHENDYLKLIIARENLAKNLMSDDANSSKSWYVGPSTIAASYKSGYFKDISSINISFSSDTEAKAELRKNSLVSVNGTLKLYTGTIPLTQIPTSELNDTNTRVLTNAELVSKFLTMYNDVYSEYKTEIPNNTSIANLVANQDLKVSYDTLNTNNASLATLVFNSLGNYQDFTAGTNTTMYYTYKPVQYTSNTGSNYYMILNLTGPNKVDVSNFDGSASDLAALIGQSVYDKIKNDLIDNNLSSSSFVGQRMGEYRESNNFELFDYYLIIDYKQVYSSYTSDNTGDTSTMCTYGDGKTITADQLLTYSLNRNAPLYLIYASQLKALLAAHYSDVYCTDTSVACSYDFINNTSEKMTEHIDAYASLKTQFESSQYATYYTFPEYIYLAYGATSEADLLEKYYVKSTLQPFLIYDALSSNNFAMLQTLQPYIDDYYNNYFSLKVKHLLIYFDRDKDGSPDDYQTFYDGLTDQTGYDILLANFETQIRTYMSTEGNTFTNLVTEYNNANTDDVTWGIYKAYGFLLKTENLSSSTSLNYKDAISKYEASFVNGLVDLYNEYQLPANIDKDHMLSDGLIETSYGVHLIYAEPGSAFEKPSFKFTMTYDSHNFPVYADGLGNDNDTYTFDQLKIYAKYRFSVITYGSADTETLYGFTQPEIPDSLLTAFDTYFSDFNDALYVIGYLNMILADELNAGTFDNEASGYCNLSASTIATQLQNVKTVYSDNLLKNFDHSE